jgi:hypothetical protein
VTALDQNDNVDTSYTGTVRFDSTDAGNRVSLPPATTFTATDAGVHTFDNVVLQTPGILALVSATDTTTATINGLSNYVYISLPPDNTSAFADTLTTQVLGRHATQGERDNATSIIQPGLYSALHTEALGLVTSDEARTRLIDNDYERFLNRAPTASEVSTALTNLQQGVTPEGGAPEQLIASILSSDEYFDDVGATNDVWLNAVYLALLHREPTTTESSGELNGLQNSPASRNQVMNYILNETEYPSDFVASIYQAYLGRQPSSDETNSWLFNGVLFPPDNGTIQISGDEQFEALVLSSTEFYWKNGNADIPWLTGVYLDVLGRSPDARGFNTNLYNLEFAYGFQRALASLNVLGGGESQFGPLSFQLPALGTEYQQKLVTGYYMTYLGRSPTTAELNAGLGVLQAAAPDLQVQALILSTSEYFAKAGGTNQNWVNAVYQALLNRAPTSTESSTAVTALNNGTMTLNQVAEGILVSDEYRTDLIQSYYSTYLGRAADATGLANALAYLDSTNTETYMIPNEYILVMILSSPEFYAKNGLQS